MHCPRCRSEDTSVVDSRLAEDGRAVRRRRECAKCQHRFTTFERQEMSNLIVVKRDGTREPYSRSKLERGIWIACTKRPITQDQIDKMLTKLEEKWGGNKKEVLNAQVNLWGCIFHCRIFTRRKMHPHKFTSAFQIFFPRDQHGL